MKKVAENIDQLSKTMSKVSLTNVDYCLDTVTIVAYTKTFEIHCHQITVGYQACLISILLGIVLGPDQNLVPVGVTKLYCDFQLDKYMRGLKMYDGLFRTVA